MNSAVIAASSSIVRKKFIGPRPLAVSDGDPMIGQPRSRGEYMVDAPSEKEARLTAAAARALAEAEARRAAQPAKVLPREIRGRDGPEPVRYGDWERRGIAVDF